MHIGIISDTHGYIDDRILSYLEKCDEVWHAGDFGSIEVLFRIRETAPVKGVFGNVDGPGIQYEVPLHQYFQCEGFRVWMTHIGGKPGNYSAEVRDNMDEYPADIFVCGHSHILQVKRDHRMNWLYINPGAAGKTGFHTKRTLLLMELEDGKIKQPRVVELG